MFRVRRSTQPSPRNLRTVRHVSSEQVPCCQNWWAETSFCLELTSSLPALQSPEASIFFFFIFGSNHCNNIDFQEQSSDLANTTSHCVHILLCRIYVFVIPFPCRCYNSGLGSQPTDRAGSHPPLCLQSACRAAPGTSSSVFMKAAEHSAAHGCPAQRAAECPLRLHRPRNGNCSLFQKDKTDSMQDCSGQRLCRIFQHHFLKEKSRSLMGVLFYTEVLIHCRSEAALSCSLRREVARYQGMQSPLSKLLVGRSGEGARFFAGKGKQAPNSRSPQKQCDFQ